MKILAIDTSTSACSVALAIDAVIHSTHQIAPMQQTKLILPTINELLNKASIQLNQLDALAFGCGPGSFTGIRIATSVIQGFAFATGLPLISVSSLAGLAQMAYQATGLNNFLVAMDARIQEVYWGQYAVSEKGLVELIDTENLSRPDEIIFPNDQFIGIGSAWAQYAEVIFQKPTIIEYETLNLAEGIIALAKDKYLKKEWLSPHEALPSYLRNEVAKKKSQ